MKVSRLTLFFFLLCGTSTVVNHAIAGPFEDYLTTNDNPAPSQYYGLLTARGVEFSQKIAQDVGGNARLAAANALVDSSKELVLKNAPKHGKTITSVPDKTIAHQVIDRLSVATALVSKDITIAGEGNEKTDACYLNLTVSKGINFAVRHGRYGTEDKANILKTFMREFHFNEGNNVTTAKQISKDLQEKHRFQLACLTYFSYAKFLKRNEDPFVFLLSQHKNFEKIIKGLEQFVKKSKIELLTSDFQSKSARSVMDVIFVNDSEQQFYEYDDAMKSFPRVIFLSARAPIKKPMEAIYNAGLNNSFKLDSTATMSTNREAAIGRLSRGLYDSNFLIKTFEDIQNVFVLLAIGRADQPKDDEGKGDDTPHDILSSILFASHMAKQKEPSTHSVVIDSLLAKEKTEAVAKLYQPYQARSAATRRGSSKRPGSKNEKKVQVPTAAAAPEITSSDGRTTPPIIPSVPKAAVLETTASTPA